MKFSEISNLDQTELLKRANKLRREFFDSRMKQKMQRLSNPLSLRFLKRDIARIQTALSSQRLKQKGESHGKK